MNKIWNFYKNMSRPLKASLWFMISSIIQKGIAIITVPLFTRILTTDEMGMVSIFNSWLTIVTIVATLKLASGGYNKAIIKFDNEKESYTSTSLFLASLFTSVMFIIYCLFKGYINSFTGMSFTITALLFLDIFFQTAISFWSIRQRFDYKYKAVVAVSVISNLLGTLVSLLLVILLPEMRSEAKIIGLVLPRVVFGAPIFISIMYKGKKLVSLKHWRFALKYNLPLVPHYLSQVLFNQTDKIMIQKLCGLSEAGIYSIANQIAWTVRLVLDALHSALMPWAFKRLKAENPEPIGKRTLHVQCAVCAIGVVFSLFSPEIFYLFGGDKYMTAVYIVPPIASSAIFVTLYTFFGYIEFYYEKTKIIMTSSIIVAVLNIVLNAIFIPVFGFIAAAYTTLASYIIYSLIHYYAMANICKHEKIKNPFDAKLLYTIAFVTTAVNLSCMLLYSYTVFRYILSFVFVLASVYVFCKKKLYNVFLK